MTRTEFKQVAERILSYWPHSLRALGEDEYKQWLAFLWEDVADYPLEQVLTALRAMQRDGREHAPNGGHIVGKLIDLAVDAPSWPKVRKTLLAVYGYQEKIWHDGADRFPRAARMAREPEQMQRFAALVGWDEIACLLDPDDRTVEAQLRDKWKTFVAGDKGDMALAGLPSAGLARLERVNGGREIGAGVLKRIEGGKR